MGDLVKRRPEGAAGIEGIEDDVAALGPVIMGDELAAGVIDQRRFAARLDAVEHLAQRGGLATAGGAQHREMARLDAVGQRDGTDGQFIALLRCHGRQRGLIDHPRAR
jgi:hypothetical protein